MNKKNVPQRNYPCSNYLAQYRVPTFKAGQENLAGSEVKLKQGRWKTRFFYRLNVIQR